MRRSSQSRRTSLAVRFIRPVQAVAALRRLVSFSALHLIICVSCTTGVLAVTPPAHGQVIDREYKLKAAYLYKFATYVAWPERAFQDADSPFVIGILGPDPVGDDLRKIAEVKTIGGRRIEVRNYANPEEVGKCHILFMARELADEAQSAAVRLLSGRHILLVGEETGFLEHGGVVDFVIEGNRIRIHVSQPAYEREELEISAQLLRIATVVK